MIDHSSYTGIAIGIGMVLSLFLTETLGVTAGGIIVPGYIALYLHDPIRVIGTFIVSLIVFGIVYYSFGLANKKFPNFKCN